MQEENEQAAEAHTEAEAEAPAQEPTSEEAVTAETVAEAPAVQEPAAEEPVAAETAPDEAPYNPEEVSYQAVEKEGTVTAIWEMQGPKHLRTIDPRSIDGKQILQLFETAG